MGDGSSRLSAPKDWLIPVAVVAGILLLLLAAVAILLLRRPCVPPPPDSDPGGISLEGPQDPAHWFENPEDADESGGTIGDEFSLEPNDELTDLTAQTGDSTLNDAPQEILTAESESVSLVGE
jgi:hypothetical protein